MSAVRLVGLGLVVGLFAGAAPADGKKGGGKVDPTPEPVGKPAGFEKGKPAHFWIWYGDGEWHIRTTTAKKPHRFWGVIATDGGAFTQLRLLKAEGLGLTADRMAWNKDRNKIAIDFTTDGGVDGADFKVGKDVTALAFDLKIDGEAAPKLIVIGKGGDRPPAAQFVLPAHPGKKK
jgi:hypothetical protein